MLTSGRTCMPTLSCLVAPPSTLVLLTGCRSRSLLLQKGNTLSGSEAPSWLLSPPSNRCGSPNKSTTSLAHPSSTGSASKPPASRPPPPTTSCPPPPYSSSFCFSKLFNTQNQHSLEHLAFLDIIPVSDIQAVCSFKFF